MPSLVNYSCPQRLQSKVIKMVDISYGGENGFNQAIDLAADCLSNVKFIQEKKLIGMFSRYFTASINCTFPPDRTLFWRSSSRFRQILLRCGGHAGSPEERCRWNTHLLGKFGYDALRIEGIWRRNWSNEPNIALDIGTGTWYSKLYRRGGKSGHVWRFSAHLTIRLQSGLQTELTDGHLIDSFFKSFSILTGILHYKVNFLRLDEAEFDDLDYEF